MKSILFIVFMVVLFSPQIACAGGSSSSRAANAAEAVLADQERNLDDLKRVLTYKGSVISKSSAVSTDGRKTTISVMDQEGYVYNFFINGDTVFEDENGASTTLGWISQNSKVIVKYLMDKAGNKTAISLTKIGVFSNKKANSNKSEGDVKQEKK